MTETIILQTKRSWWAELWLFIAALLFIAASIWNILVPNILIPIIMNSTYVISGLLFGIFIFFVIIAVIDHYRIIYIITDKRAIRKVGIIARYEKSVFYEEVTDVRLHQNIMDKILGIGSIEVDTAGEGIEIIIEDVRNPGNIYNIVNSYIMGNK